MRLVSLHPTLPVCLLLVVSLVLLHHATQAQAAASMTETEKEFDAWMTQHHKTYGSAEEKAQRYQHWLEAYGRVQQHIHPHYQLGLNSMSDWSPLEHAQRLQRGSSGKHHLGFHIPAGWRRKFVEEFGGSHPRVFDGRGEPSPPPEVDWRDPNKNPKQVKGVTSVRNQLFCGGCYSFGVVAAVEGVVAADRDYLNALSDEQIIDCDAENSGCEGGDPQVALRYVMEQPLVAKADYPFSAGMGHAGQCALNEAAPASQIQSYLYVQPCDETVLMQAVARGPVVVAIDAYCDAFMQYAGGVLSDSCVDVTGAGASVDAVCEESLNHALAIVGYGTDTKTGLDYWVIKNSWGTSWGEKGFARVLRGGGGGGEGGKECGVGCLEYYNFLPTGGVAFVNGTALADDDFPVGSVDEEGQRELFFMDVLVGMAVALAVLMVVSGVQKLRRRQRQKQPGGAAGGALTEPLLQLEDEEITTLGN